MSLGRRLAEQIDRIWRETARRKGEGAAERVLGRIAEVLVALRRQPLMGVPGRRRGKERRRFLAGEYWIYYRVVDGVARVDGLRHFKQDQSKDWDATNG